MDSWDFCESYIGELMSLGSQSVNLSVVWIITMGKNFVKVNSQFQKNNCFIYGMSAGKRDQIEIFFKKKFLSKIDHLVQNICYLKKNFFCRFGPFSQYSSHMMHYR